MVRKGVPAPPILTHPPLEPACPLFKIFVFPPPFSVPPPLKLFYFLISIEFKKFCNVEKEGGLAEKFVTLAKRKEDLHFLNF